MISPGAEAARPTRVVFLGTPEFAVPSLRALLALPGLVIPLVITQPDRPAGRGRRLTPSAIKVLADEHGLPTFQPERLRGPEVVERLREADADLFVIAAYGQLLRQAVLDLPHHGCFNVHPSLLPRHRGPSPIVAAILAGDERTGVTIMLTERGMDTGPILSQEVIALGREETAATLGDRLSALGADLLVRTIPRWLVGEITPRAQDEAEATVTRTFARADGALDWSRPALDLERQVRAFNPWPRAYTFEREKRLLLLLAQAIDDDPADRAPGAIYAGADGTMLVATGAGAFRVDEVQPEGRRPLPAALYLRANPRLIGLRLDSRDGGAGDIRG